MVVEQTEAHLTTRIQISRNGLQEGRIKSRPRHAAAEEPRVIGSSSGVSQVSSTPCTEMHVIPCRYYIATKICYCLYVLK